MTTTIPSIACLGVIGKNSNPLHITLFPPTYLSSPTTAASQSQSQQEQQQQQQPRPLLTPLQFSLLLSSTLDIFHARAVANASGGNGNLSGDLGLLHAVDERLAAYGFETNTGVRFVCVIDVAGREIRSGLSAGGAGGGGLREGELKVVFRAMQAAYVRLLQNPFFDPDEHSPPGGRGGRKITSRKFTEEMRRIGETWAPGVGNL